MGSDGTAVGPGASAAAADRAITGMTSDSDPSGSVYSRLRLYSKKQTKKSIKLNWTGVGGAGKYVVYGNACGKGNKMKKLTTLGGTTASFTNVAGRKVKKGTYYKFIVVALDQNNNVVSTSKIVHVATQGGKVTNPKKITLKKGKKGVSKVSIGSGKTVKIKSKVTKQKKKGKLKKHRKVQFESSNTQIATVGSNGVIKGVSKGTCYVYAYAQNGVYKSIKVTVR